MANAIAILTATGALITTLTTLISTIKGLKEIDKRTRRNEILSLMNIDYSRNAIRNSPPEHYIEIHELIDEYESKGYNGYIKEKIKIYDSWYTKIKIGEITI